MATYLVVNTTDATVSNINAGGIDVPANSVRSAVLTDTELGVIAHTAGIGICKSDATYQIKREIAKALKHYKSATGAAL